jgi:hypothetical protein
MGPEQTRLMSRLFDDPKRKLRNFHITPGDKASSAEEICAEVNKAMDQVECRRAAGDLGDEPPKSGRPRVDLRALLDCLPLSNGDR